jgi:hypothetical protein
MPSSLLVHRFHLQCELLQLLLSQPWEALSIDRVKTLLLALEGCVLEGHREKGFWEEALKPGDPLVLGRRLPSLLSSPHVSMRFSANRLAYSCHTLFLTCHDSHSEEASTDRRRLISTTASAREWLRFAQIDACGSTPREPLHGNLRDEKEQQWPTVPEPQVSCVLEMSQETGTLYDRATWLR